MEETSRPSKIEITKWPSSKKSHLSAWAILISILSLLFTIIWSFHTNNQIVDVQSAKIVLAETAITTSQPTQESEEIKVNLELGIKNIGQSTAKNPNFKIFFIDLKRDSLECSEENYINPSFNDGLINDIDPNTEETFGNIFFNINRIVKIQARSEYLLVINLSYLDSFSETHIDRWFWYKYSAAGSKLYSLLKNELSFEEINIVKKVLQDYPDAIETLTKIYKNDTK